jgi:hypothetical protein
VQERNGRRQDRRVVGGDKEIEEDYIRRTKTILWNKIKNLKGMDNGRMNEYFLKAKCTR